jgi:CheY-like chemotaxis protein
MNKETIENESATAPGDTEAHRKFCAELNQKLRAPLNSILGFAELVSLNPGDSRKSGDLQQILKSARELLTVIEHELGDPDNKSTAGFDRSTQTTASKCDLLYIEDEEVNFTLVERILEFRPKVKLLHAPQGQTGLELAELHRPKMILLDLNLPDMHGAEVLQKLQRNPATAEIPVVILSANATASQIERLLTAGARNYLTKPFDIDPFLAVVDELTAAA